MNKRIGSAQEIRNKVLAGIAVMNEDLEKAEDLLVAITAPGELLTFEGNRFAMFAAVTDEALDGLTDFQEALESKSLRYCLALSVPVSDLQTEPTTIGGKVVRTFCSTIGLPVRTQQEVEDGNDTGYKFVFKRPSFWLIKLIVDDASKVTYMATLMGQYRNEAGMLEYRPVTRKTFDQASDSDVEKPITKKITDEETASRELNVNSGFLFAMTKPCLQQAESGRRRQGLRASINRTTIKHEPLTASLAESFPGLESLKKELETAEAPTKPAKKAKKPKTAEDTAEVTETAAAV